MKIHLLNSIDILHANISTKYKYVYVHRYIRIAFNLRGTISHAVQQENEVFASIK